MAYQSSFCGVRLAGKPTDTLWDVICEKGQVKEIRVHQESRAANQDGRLLTPSLCHPHIHLDKCFLLSHPKYSDLEIRDGDFAEAMRLTSEAKLRFEPEDLLERGRVLIKESINFGVTHMRAFVEVDAMVRMKCLEAGLLLKAEFKDICCVQICAFAQEPIYSQPDGGKDMLKLMEEAAAWEGVDVIGSTPYVESSLSNRHANIEWMIGLAKKYVLHLDFHLDYNLDFKIQPTVYHVIQELEKVYWSKQRFVALGHCSRLTYFSVREWQDLHDRIGSLPIFFIGLPTSDLFMMGRPDKHAGGGERIRGTLQIPQMIREYGLQGALGINNVGNAFTPHGSCDPLSIAALGVGIYQAGTKADAEILMQCVSTRAMIAIGLGTTTSLEIKEGDTANFVVFGTIGDYENRGFRYRKSVTEIVYDACRERATVFKGVIVSGWGEG